MEGAAREFRTIAVDLPGVGESPTAVAGGSKQALAALVHDLIGQLELKNATLVGHDIGGMIAYAYLRRYQDVAQVVIVDVVVPGIAPWDEVLHNPHLWHFAFHAIPALPELLVQGHQGAYLDYFFNALATDASRITPDARATYAQAYGSDAQLAAGFDFYRALAEDARDNSAAIGATTDTPVLYIRGEGSRGNIDSYAEGLRAAGVRHLTARLIPNTGHFIPDEQPAELWQHIHEFLTATGPNAQ